MALFLLSLSLKMPYMLYVKLAVSFSPRYFLLQSFNGLFFEVDDLINFVDSAD